MPHHQLYDKYDILSDTTIKIIVIVILLMFFCGAVKFFGMLFAKEAWCGKYRG